MSALPGRLSQAEEAELKQLRSTPFNQVTESQLSRRLVLDAKRKAKASERNTLIFWVVAVLFFFYCSIDAGMRDYKRFNQATRLAQGRVVGDAYYKFKVKGVVYEGFGNWESLSQGDRVQVYYNRTNPSFNHAKGDAPKDGFFNQFTVFGILCLIALILVVRDQQKNLAWR